MRWTRPGTTRSAPAPGILQTGGRGRHLHPVLPDVWSAQVIQEHGPDAGVLGRATLGFVAVPHNGQCHSRRQGTSARSGYRGSVLKVFQELVNHWSYAFASRGRTRFQPMHASNGWALSSAPIK
jgi:hypothetical protein